MKNTVIRSSILAAIFAATSPFAIAETKPTGSGPNPYADCGIGAALFPSTHWAAALSNVIWDLGTTAVTSATASPETCNGKEAKAAQFILENYDNLVEETARGEGQHLTAMYAVLGCQADSHNVLTSDIRKDMAVQVMSTNYAGQHPVAKASAFYDIVNSAVESSSADSCSV